MIEKCPVCDSDKMNDSQAQQTGVCSSRCAKMRLCVPAPTATEVSTAVDAINPHRRPTTPGVGVEALIEQERAIAVKEGRGRSWRPGLDTLLLSGAIAGHVALALELWRWSGR